MANTGGDFIAQLQQELTDADAMSFDVGALAMKIDVLLYLMERGDFEQAKFIAAMPLPERGRDVGEDPPCPRCGIEAGQDLPDGCRDPECPYLPGGSCAP